MSVLRKNKGKRFLKQCIAFCVVLALVLAAPIAAGATAAEAVTAQEMTDALNALQQELSMAAMTVNSSLPEATEEVPGEAEGSAAGLMPETQIDMVYRCQELASSVIEKINGHQQSYLRKDLLEYVQFFTSCMRRSAQLQTCASAMQSKITSCTDLEQEAQQSLLTAVQTVVDPLKDCPFGELADNLAAAEQWTASINREQVDAWSNSLGDNEQLQKRYDTLIELLPDWTEAKQTLDQIEAILNNYSGENRVLKGEAATAAAKTLQALCDEKNLVAEMMKHYADGSDADQNAIPEQIADLCGRMDSVVAECLAECVQENRTQAFVQKDLTNRVSDLEGKVLFAYIALIVAAVSLVLGIAALVIGLNKSRVKALEQKTHEIQQKADEFEQKQRDDAQRLNKRIEQLSLDMVKPIAAERETAELKRIIERMRKEQESRTNNSNISNMPIEAVMDNTPKPVGYLHLNYNSVAPQMSLFEQKESGKYVLYSDETIAPVALPQTNTAEGWVRNGLCYLFDLEYNNRVVQPAELGDSYYEIMEVAERAKVEDRKKLVQKGILRIQKRS